jgi:hypothetical protein
LNETGDNNENKGFVKDFTKCPGCGSTERYFEDILKELKERGLTDAKATHFDFQIQQGLALPQTKIAVMPFGSEISSFTRIWDTCCNCGLVYSIHLAKGYAKKSIQLAPAQAMPNRAERRRMEKSGIPPQFNNPLLS